MGITRQRERERGEMYLYLLLILLVSPAFGRPSSDQLDVGGDISNQLKSFINFSKETGKILENSNLTEKMVVSLLGAEQNLLEVETELKVLQSKIPELQGNKDNYFPIFNEAKYYLRETRQKLREFAHFNVIEVNDLKILMKIDNDPVLLNIVLERMKDLMIETAETLNIAKERSNNAMQSFKTLISDIASKNEQLEKMLSKDSAEYKAWVTKMVRESYKDKLFTLVVLGETEVCKQEIERFFHSVELGQNLGLGWTGNCSASFEDEIYVFEEKLENMKTILERMLESGENFDETIQEAMEILTGEIKQIRSRIETADDVSKNIDKYPKDYLKEYQNLATDFLIGLDDLENSSEKFLDQPKNLIDIYRQYLAEAERMNVAENLLNVEKSIFLEVSASNLEVDNEYLPAYHKTKYLLKETRQQLRDLAHRTVTNVRDLKIVLEHLDESNNSVYFNITINRMNDIDPLEILKEARETYESAVKTFEDTNSFIATYMRESKSGKKFVKTLKVFIEILSEEIELISVWTKSAKGTSYNIDNNSEEILREFQSVRKIFMNGFDDLENDTNTFLAQPKNVIRLEE